MIKSYNLLTLRGNICQEGIAFQNGIIDTSARRGGSQSWETTLLGVNTQTKFNGVVKSAQIRKVIVRVRKYNDNEYPNYQLVFQDSSENLDLEYNLVLVQEYFNPSGRKRYPGFQVNLEESFLRVVKTTTFFGGSGEEKWHFVLAPVGWAQNIASQFINWRDEPTVVLSFKP